MFEKIYDVKYHEINTDGVLKPSALMEYLEDIAAKNADSLNFGYDEITAKNYGWFLLKYAMEFYNYPQNVMQIKIATEPRGANKLFAYRDFYIYDENDNLLGKVASTWGLIDFNTKSMISPLEVFEGKMHKFEKKETDVNYNKIPPIQNITCEKIFEVRYDDIDVNHHVNNATYIVWAFEALPIEFLSTKKLKHLDINYKKEVKYGNSVSSVVSVDNDASIHYIKSAAEDLCTLLAAWE